MREQLFYSHTSQRGLCILTRKYFSSTKSSSTTTIINPYWAIKRTIGNIEYTFGLWCCEINCQNTDNYCEACERSKSDGKSDCSWYWMDELPSKEKKRELQSDLKAISILSDPHLAKRWNIISDWNTSCSSTFTLHRWIVHTSRLIFHVVHIHNTIGFHFCIDLGRRCRRWSFSWQAVNIHGSHI